MARKANTNTETKARQAGKAQPERTETMDRQELIKRFEDEMTKVTRPGVDKLMDYIRKSDFYTAPASTKYHLACEGGLLLHSLNVLDALRSLLTPAFKEDGTLEAWEYRIAGKAVAAFPDESVTIAALLHDICKTFFYGTSTRNVKNEKTGKWEKAPYYTVEDRMPLGHGDKSAMIIKQYMELQSMEMYAIWWHMGFTGNFENDTCVGAAIRKYPLVLALHTADMMASKIMEAETDNEPLFIPADPEPQGAAQDAAAPATGAPPMNPSQEDIPDFQEAPPLQPGA